MQAHSPFVSPLDTLSLLCYYAYIESVLKGSDNVSTADKVEQLTRGFLSLSEEGKQYVLAVVDALAYASEVTRKKTPPEDKPKKSS